MTILDSLPVPAAAAQVALLTAKHQRLLARVDALASQLEGLSFASRPGIAKELRNMAAEARS